MQVINEHKQIQNENTNLISHNTQKDIFIAESKAENDIKSKKIKSLESMIKILEGKLSLAQKDMISIHNDSSKKETEIVSLKFKIAELKNIKSELESKVNELECLKSENRLGMQVPLSHNMACSAIIGGDEEGQSFIVPTIKNITKPDDISAVLQSRPLGDSLNHV